MNRLSIFLVSMLASLTALADWEVNMPRGVTPTANAAYDLHMLIFYITVVIGIVAVSYTHLTLPTKRIV